MSRRIVLESPCEHHEMQAHVWFTEKQRLVRDCPGGSRTVLTEPTEEMVERAAIAIFANDFPQLEQWDRPIEELWEALRPTAKQVFLDKAEAALITALFSSDVGEREETE